MPIIKSIGATRTERLLADLCERSFMKLWSYPSPYKDDGKELCDLLAVFENQVFIFFDRESRQFDNLDSDPLVRWDRWKRKVIDSQIRTAHGAERYLRGGRAVFLDCELSVPFPISIDVRTMAVHKIIVAHGAAEACKQFSDQNVYGSLGVAYGRKDHKAPFPFTVDLDRENPVHVLDSHNLPIIFEELDTVSDLSSYLDAKLDAIRKYTTLLYCGEEDLLAHYFLNFDSATNKHFIGTPEGDFDWVLVAEGEWEHFLQSGPYKRKKLADRESYLWDELIQRTCQNALDGTMLGNSNLLRGKSAIHEMAKEPRFLRRELSRHMIQSIRDFPQTSQPIVRHLSFMPSFYKDKAYVFLQLKMEKIDDYDGYRQGRYALLELACASAKNKFDHLNKVVGIAIDAPKFTRRNSEDFILLECADWPDEQRKHYEQINNEGFNFFKSESLIRIEKKATEFPSS